MKYECLYELFLIYIPYLVEATAHVASQMIKESWNLT